MTDLSGTLEGLGLPAVVRFLSGLHKSGCLRIEYQDWHGEVFFDAGRVTSAALGSRTGPSALDALVQALPGGTFTFDSEFQPPAEGNIDLSQEALEAHLDELVARTASGSPSLPSLDAVPHVVPLTEHSPGEDAVPLDRGSLQTLLAVDGLRSVRDIVAQRASFEALWQIANLAQLGLVRMERPNPVPSAVVVHASRQTTAGVATAAPVAPPPVKVDEPVALPPVKVDEPVAPPPVKVHEPVAPPPVKVDEPSTSVVPVAPSARTDEPTLAADVATFRPVAPTASAVIPAGVPKAAPDVTVQVVHCPKLGFEDDPTSSFGRPTRLHRCFAASTPLPLSLDQQRELCLSEQFGTCPRLASAVAGEPESATQRPAAAAESTSRPETDLQATDPRIVRLPFAGRNGGQRSTTGDLQTVASVEPARWRPPSVNPRDGGSARPTPLRTRMLRPTGAAAAAAAVVTDADPTRLVADPVESTTPAVNLGGIDATRRPTLFGVPVPLLAGIGLIVIVVGLVAALLMPNLDSPLLETEIDSEALPNASAFVAGTPISQLTAPRATEVPALTETQPRVETQGTQATPAESRPTAVPIAAAPAAAPSGPRALLDESFNDNNLNWLNNPQGVANVTGGTYRIVPRQTAQFVAIGAPIPDILRDVVVSATFRKVGGPAGGGYGIIVRDQGPGPRDGVNQSGRYYVLEAGDKGEVGIWRRDGDRWIDILPWQRSDAVRTGNAVNELTVRAIGDRLSLSVNGAEVATASDSALSAGGVGVFVGGDGNQVALEHLSVQTP